MVVQVRRDTLRLIRQLDHSLACGRMALAWTGAAVPFDVAAGIGLHDFAWGLTDREPVLDPRTGGPVTFLSIDDDERSRMFRDGLDRQERIDEAATILASLHYTRFLEAREPETFAAHEGARRARLIARRTDGRDEADWNRFADLLRHFDDLSLYVCLAAPESLECPDWLTAERAGTAPDGTRCALSWRDASTLVLHPFPFARALDLEIPCRDLPRRPYTSAEDLALAWRGAAPSAHRVRLAPAAEGG